MTSQLRAGRYIILLIFICVMFLSFHAGLRSQAGSDAMVDLLPRSGFSKGWVLDGTIKHYTADNLYVYINGEAELYLPYGFEVLGSAFYSRGENADSGIVADVYRMRSPLDAFGIYSNYRDAGAEQVKAGAGGFISESQLMFFKDRYFVRLSVSGTVADERALLMRCADAIAGKITGSASLPEALGILDIPEVAPDTVRYLAQSVLGYVFFRRGLTAEAVIEGEPARIFVIFCGSPEESSRTLEDYVNYLKESGVVADRRGSGKEMTLIAGDPLYKGTVIRTSGGYLFGATRLKDPLKAIPVLNRIGSLINRP